MDAIRRAAVPSIAHYAVKRSGRNGKTRRIQYGSCIGGRHCRLKIPDDRICKPADQHSNPEYSVPRNKMSRLIKRRRPELRIPEQTKHHPEKQRCILPQRLRKIQPAKRINRMGHPAGRTEKSRCRAEKTRRYIWHHTAPVERRCQQQPARSGKGQNAEQNDLVRFFLQKRAFHAKQQPFSKALF